MLHVAKRGPHVVDGHKTIDAKCRGEYVADGLPNWWHSTARPRQSGDEKQRHRGEYNEHDAHLAVPHKGAYRHAKRNAGNEKG